MEASAGLLLQQECRGVDALHVFGKRVGVEARWFLTCVNEADWLAEATRFASLRSFRLVPPVKRRINTASSPKHLVGLGRAKNVHKKVRTTRGLTGQPQLSLATGPPSFLACRESDGYGQDCPLSD